jgi:hypothetical protein
MLRCLGKNIFLLQSVPLFAGLFQELECLVYGMGPILYLLKITRKTKFLDTEYKIDNHTLLRVQHHPYLGVELTSDLTWKHHIGLITGKAQKIRQFKSLSIDATLSWYEYFPVIKLAPFRWTFSRA